MHGTQVVTRSSFATAFPLTENPISEGGNWRHQTAWWTSVQTNGAGAFGTMPATGGLFNDSYAYLLGFPQNVSVSAVVSRSGSAGNNQEIEFHFRMSDTAESTVGAGDDTCRSYEITYSLNGNYSGIVRWNGGHLIAEGNGFDTLLAGPTYSPLADGDVVSATMVGTVITAKINGSTLFTHDVSTGVGAGLIHTTGNPGIAFFRADNPTAGPNTAFGFKSYSAVGL